MLTNASENLARLSNERAAKDGVSYEEALRRISHENPKLARRARSFVTRGTATEFGEIEGVERAGRAMASGRIEHLAQARAKELGVDYATALSEVCRENVELAREYQREISRADD